MDLKERAKELKIKGAHLMKEDTLKAKIAEAEVDTPIEPEVVPDAPVIDVANPDAEALAKRQQEASIEARMKAMEDRLVQAEEKNMRLESEAAVLRNTVHKKPTKNIPEAPNPNMMLYRKDDKDKRGYIHKQFSPVRAKQLIAEGEWVNSPAKITSEG